MFSRKPNPRLVELDVEISRVLATMSRMEPDDEEYANATTQWVKLCEERDNLLSNRFSKDQLLLVGGNVLIAIVIIGHERANVIATKVPQFLSKASR